MTYSDHLIATHAFRLRERGEKHDYNRCPETCRAELTGISNESDEERVANNRAAAIVGKERRGAHPEKIEELRRVAKEAEVAS